MAPLPRSEPGVGPDAAKCEGTPRTALRHSIWNGRKRRRRAQGARLGRGARKITRGSKNLTTSESLMRACWCRIKRRVLASAIRGNASPETSRRSEGKTRSRREAGKNSSGLSMPQKPRRRSPAKRVQPQSKLTPNIARRSEAGITTRERPGPAWAQARLTCHAGPSMARHSGHRAPTTLLASVSQCLGAPAAYSQRPKPLRA